MGHPLLDEFCRAREFRADFLRRCQREFRDTIQPLLDERDALLTENATLKAQLEAVPARRAAKPTEAA